MLETKRFLKWVRLGLHLAFALAGMWFVLGYAIVGNVANAGPWLVCLAFLLDGPMQVAWSNSSSVANNKWRYAAKALFNTACALFLSHALLEYNPWLLWLYLALFWLLLLYSKECVFYTMRTHFVPPRSNTRATLLCLVAIACAGALLLTSEAWLVSVLYGATALGFQALMWYMPRREAAISDDQHADIWPRYLQRPHMVACAWSHFQGYMQTHHDVPDSALQRTLKKQCDPDVLLQYFPGTYYEPSQYPGLAQLTRLVEKRICELDPHAAVIFDMHMNDKNNAAQSLKDMRRGNLAPLDVLDLPDLDFQLH